MCIIIISIKLNFKRRRLLHEEEVERQGNGKKRALQKTQTQWTFFFKKIFFANKQLKKKIYSVDSIIYRLFVYRTQHDNLNEIYLYAI